jgi:hypothetical protein
MIIPAVLAMSAARPSLVDAAELDIGWLLNPTTNPFVQGGDSQSSGPLSNTVSGSYTFSPGATWTGTETDTANYGRLFASGAGSATAVPGDGSDFFIGNSTDSYNGAVVQYHDTLTIHGTGPVSIGFEETFNSTTSFTPHADSFTSDFLFVTGSGGWTTELDGSGTSERVLTFNPGDQVVINDFISGGCGASLANGSPPDPSTASCSFQGSDQLYLNVLTAGGSYTAASGTDYAVAPAPNSVPEPATWAMMLLGFGVLGGAMRLRRKSASVTA